MRIDPNVPLNPINWSYILEGRFAKCCPRVQCCECRMNRLITPRLLVKCEIDQKFKCESLGLTCFSFVQTKPCDSLSNMISALENAKSGGESRENQIPSKEIELPMVSQCSSIEQRLFESGTPLSRASNTSLSPSDAFNRGPRPERVQYSASTLLQRQEYELIVKENPNVFGIRALGKLATSNQAPTYAAEKSISTWLTWKSAWEGLFAKHGVSNPIAQAQVAMLSLKGEAQDWWNTRWQSNPEPYITWDGLTTLLRATFYPLDAQDNAFTAWNAVEFTGNVAKFFDEVRRVFRTYPISMEHLLSILTLRLGKSFARKVKTRLASGIREELSIYELEAIADELLTQEKGWSIPKTTFYNVKTSQNNDSSNLTSSVHSQKHLSSAASTPHKTTGSKTVKTSPLKRKVAAIETTPLSRNRYCFLCGDPSHFCYQCPQRRSEGCVICGQDHEWQDCPDLKGKFVRKKSVACLSLATEEGRDSDYYLTEEKQVAELSAPQICWQTHKPLYLSTIDSSPQLPFRSACIHTPSPSRRLVYRCKLHDIPVCCLFDSGANCSLISLAWVKKKNIPCRSVENSVKTAVQDEKTSKFMTLPLKLEINNFHTTWQFFVLPELSHDVFLGTDFMLFHRVTFDPFDWSMVILGAVTDENQFPAFFKTANKRRGEVCFSSGDS